MPKKELRHKLLADTWKDARQQLAENAADTEEALGDKVTGRLVTVAGYRATGATTTKIDLGLGTSEAKAALLVRAALSRDAGADVAVTPRLNFAPSTTGLGVYEPSGLAQYAEYDLTFLVLE